VVWGEGDMTFAYSERAFSVSLIHIDMASFVKSESMFVFDQARMKSANVDLLLTNVGAGVTLGSNSEQAFARSKQKQEESGS
jgi:hypothetical protein